MIHEILANDRHWFLLFTVPSALGLATLILYVSRKIASKKLQDLAGALNTTVVMRLFQGPYISVYHDGVENRIGVTTGGRNSPPYLILKQLTPLGFALSISKENPMTRGLGEYRTLQRRGSWRSCI